MIKQYMIIKRCFIFINISVQTASSNFLAFTNTKLYHNFCDKKKLQKDLCVFGDCVYTNTVSMFIPFCTNVSHGPKDDFNYYYSRVQISIKCAFSILVRRWGVLQKPILVNISVKRTSPLIKVLCILHNFCINNNKSNVDDLSSSDYHNVSSEVGDFSLERGVSRREFKSSGYHDNIANNLKHDVFGSTPRNCLLHNLKHVAQIVKQSQLFGFTPTNSNSTNKDAKDYYAAFN